MSTACSSSTLSTTTRVSEALQALGLPAVVIGDPFAGVELPAVWHDEASAMVEAVRYLAALGHRRIARVSGAAEFVHTAAANEAFRDAMRELGLHAEVVATDYTPESGARATRRLLSSPKPPTAIIFDSDLLAVTGLGVAQQMGFTVPDDLSLIGWDDSLISRVVHPPLTAITRDIGAYGATAAAHLLAVIEGKTHEDVEVALGRADPAWQHRSAAQRRAGARACDLSLRTRRYERLFARCGKSNPPMCKNRVDTEPDKCWTTADALPGRKQGSVKAGSIGFRWRAEGVNGASLQQPERVLHQHQREE